MTRRAFVLQESVLRSMCAGKEEEEVVELLGRRLGLGLGQVMAVDLAAVVARL